MKTSESIQKLTAALLKAQAEVHNVTKDSRNPHFGNTYASLTAVIEAVKPVFNSHGLAIVQMPGFENGHATLDVLISHESGEWLQGTAGAPLQKDDPQGVGSAITYLRRYTLAALAGIGQEDDDGNAASSRGSVNGRKAAPEDIDDMIACPGCGGPMWDNRDDEKASINGGKRPDIKCKDKECDHAVWLGSWRDKLKSDLADAHASQAIDAEQRARGDEAAESLSPKRMLALEEWLDKQVSKAILGGAKEASPA